MPCTDIVWSTEDLLQKVVSHLIADHLLIISDQIYIVFIYSILWPCLLINI